MNKIQLHKLGGASTKTPEFFLAHCVPLLKFFAEQNFVTILVMSAIGGITSMLEDLISLKLKNDPSFEMVFKNFKDHIRSYKQGLGNIPHGLDRDFVRIERNLHSFNLQTSQQQDAVLACGEILSLKLFSAYMKVHDISHSFIRAEENIVTTEGFGDAYIDVEKTAHCLGHPPVFKEGKSLRIVAGYIGRTPEKNAITTLGREGSDYTATVLAHIAGTSCVNLFKTEKGVLPDLLTVEPLAHITFDQYRNIQQKTKEKGCLVSAKAINFAEANDLTIKIRNILTPHKVGTTISSLGVDL